MWRLEGRGPLACLVIGGDLDVAAAADFDALLRDVDAFGTSFRAELAEVGFADTFGLLPLRESTRRRRAVSTLSCWSPFTRASAPRPLP